jgi:hypothetical protein
VARGPRDMSDEDLVDHNSPKGPMSSKEVELAHAEIHRVFVMTSKIAHVMTSEVAPAEIQRVFVMTSEIAHAEIQRVHLLPPEVGLCSSCGPNREVSEVRNNHDHQKLTNPTSDNIRWLKLLVLSLKDFLSLPPLLPLSFPFPLSLPPNRPNRNRL